MLAIELATFAWLDLRDSLELVAGRCAGDLALVYY